MRITRLTLENFRSFKDKQTIEFAPVTLLFGPNSVGKSTVLMALVYAHHIFTESDCNPLRLEALGNKYIGGFKGLVHGRDLNRTIRIGIEYSKDNLIGSTYNEMRGLLEEIELDDIEWLFNLSDASGSVSTVEVDLSISWSKQQNRASVSECLIKLDRQEFAILKANSGVQQGSIESLNYLHPILVNDEHDDWVEQCFDNGSLHPRNEDRAFELRQESEEDLPKIDDRAFATAFHETLNVSRMTDDELYDSGYMCTLDGVKFIHKPVAYASTAGCIPVLNKPLETPLDFDDKKVGAMICEILSDAIIPVFDNLCSLLNESLFIGPLRSIPDPGYQANPNPQTKDWFKGLAAWDYLDSADLPILKKIDRWMREELVLGYGLSLKLEKSFHEYKKSSNITSFKDIAGQLNEQITDSFHHAARNNLSLKLDDEATKLKYALWDDKSQIEVHGCDVGVGVSQILPFIVASVSRKSGLVAIEQPELHVHPRVQVGIGDLLTQVNSDVGFLVETHSEHIVLRLLKRIRQTSDEELPDNIKPVTKDDVSIIYLELSDTGVKSKRIHIDEVGEFEERWPQGFFVERREELL